MEFGKRHAKEMIVVLSLIAAAFLIFYLPQNTFSDTGVFSGEAINVSFCNVQGYVFDAAGNAVKNSTIVTCNLGRNNGINTTYNVSTGKDVAEGYNNSYRCTMICSNVIADTVSVMAFNATDNGTGSITFSGSTAYLNITLNDYIAPQITGVTGNRSSYVNTNIPIDVNATDNSGIRSIILVLGNGSIISMAQENGNIYSGSIVTPLNSMSTITYYAAAYDGVGNNVNSSVYYISVSDNVAPTATLSANQTSIDQNEYVSFTASSSSDNIGIAGYRWIFGDGTESTSSTVLHTFSNPGSYNVVLTATDNSGNNASASTTISVRDAVPPFVVSNVPTNSSVNVSYTTQINITFNEAMLTATLTSHNIAVASSDGINVYGKISFDTVSNKTTFAPYMLLEPNKMYIVTVSRGVQDSSTNNLSSQYTFSFTTKQSDIDNDGIPDSEESDADDDGILDTDDTVLGTSTNIKCEGASVNVTIDGNDNISQEFSGTKEVKILDSTVPVIAFNHDFSTRLELANISVYESDNTSVGEMIVSGIKLNGATKTIYLPKKSSYSSVCIRDAETTSIEQISQTCTGTGEYKIYCNGTAQGSYTCTYDSNIDKYNIIGLSNSGVREIDYTPISGNPPQTPQTPPNGPAGGGGGGGSICSSRWVCGSWSECTPSSIQTRECIDEKECNPATTQPQTQTTCVYIPPMPKKEEQQNEEKVAGPAKGTEEKKEENLNNINNGEKMQTAKEKNTAMKALTGKAYNAVFSDKANIYFMLFIGLLLAGLFVFHTIHDKREAKIK